MIQKRQRASDDRLAPPELRLPEAGASHRGSGAATAAIVTGREQASAFGRDAERREETAAHPQAAREPRLGAPADEKPGVSPGKHRGERALLRLNQLPQWVRGF